MPGQQFECTACGMVWMTNALKADVCIACGSDQVKWNRGGSGEPIKMVPFINLKRSTVGSWRWVRVDTYRPGLLEIDGELKQVTCSEKTLLAMAHTEQSGGKVAENLRAVVALELDLAEARMKVSMLDVTKSLRGGKVVDRRTVTKLTGDRLQDLVAGIGDLVAQMAQFTNGAQSPTDEQVQNFARRYAEYADAIRQADALLVNARGQFETAQAQVMALMA